MHLYLYLALAALLATGSKPLAAICINLGVAGFFGDGEIKLDEPQTVAAAAVRLDGLSAAPLR